MKRLLFLALGALFTLCSNAQDFQVNKDFTLPTNGQIRPISKAQRADGNTVWGYYCGDESGLYALAWQSGGLIGSFREAMFVPGDGVLAGGKIVGVRIPLTSTKLTTVTTFGGTGLTSTTYKKTYSVKVDTFEVGYNEIMFTDTAYTIPAKGMYVGYSFRVTELTTNGEIYPLLVGDANEAAKSLYMAKSISGSMSNYSQSGYGVCPMQLIVSGIEVPENNVAIQSVTCYASAMGAQGTVTADLVSNGTTEINDLTYSVNVNNVEETGTIHLAEPIPAGFNQAQTVEIPFTAPNEIGTFDANVAITKVNGEDNSKATELTTFEVQTLSRIIPRMSVVEEYTGTGCGYCPMGWVSMEKVKKNLSDKAAVIALHQYNSTDPMYPSDYANLGISSAPTCTIDRESFIDSTNGLYPDDIEACVESYNVIAPTVDVKVSAFFGDADYATVKGNAQTEFLTNTTGYSIAFVLTADSLTGTSNSWLQSNYYYQYSSEGAGDLAPFCYGGEYGSSTVRLVFDDVMIGSTYVNGKTSLPAFTTGNAGDKETTEGIVAMPTSDELKTAVSARYKVYLTALVIDNNGRIANAARVKVKPYDPTGISVVNEDNTENENVIYNLAGQRVNANAKGILIKNGKKFIVK